MKKFKRIYIEITNKCNYKCKFCPESKRKLENITVENFEKVLQKIENYTDYIYLHVKGEPLTHSKLQDILQKAKEHNLYVVITTNGSLLKDKKEILKNSNNIRQINISVHSIEQNENKKIEEEQYMNDIIKSADEINKFNNCYISYRLWNMKNIKDIGLNSKLLNILGDSYNVGDILSIAKEKSFIKLENNKYVNLDTVYEWPSLEHEFISETGACYGLIDQIAILVDGTVVPCCLDQEGDINLGNIYDLSLEEILNSDLAKKIYSGFKNNKLVNPLCQRCGFREEKRR